MKKGKYKQLYAGPDGWSDWHAVNMGSHRAACCDCGLVHEYSYKVLKVLGYRGRGRVVTGSDRIKGMQVIYRVRRLNRATAARRRAKELVKVKKALK